MDHIWSPFLGAWSEYCSRRNIPSRVFDEGKTRSTDLKRKLACEPHEKAGTTRRKVVAEANVDLSTSQQAEVSAGSILSPPPHSQLRADATTAIGPFAVAVIGLGTLPLGITYRYKRRLRLPIRDTLVTNIFV